MTQNDNLNGNEIAIIGMALRAPGARDYRQFWENLCEGRENIAFFTDEELKELGKKDERYKHPDFVPTKGGALKDKDCFDAELFGYGPKDANLMDPQVRILHECAWSVLEDAGYNHASYPGAIGMYAGAAMNLNWAAQMLLSGKSRDISSQEFSIHVNKDFMATRISYALDLRGPSVSVQTACSTSLVAIHMACQALLEGECDMAMAGGVSLLPDGEGGYLKSEDMPFSADGHCRAFDADASGVVFGEGAGLVLLKPYEDALRDGDNITAVIKGSAINNDGAKKAAYIAPGVQAQSEVIQTAMQVADLPPESIGYIEAHGTATKIGDPIEVKALINAFNTNKAQYCALGSVKTNVGHLNCAAGVAGLIKAALCLKHRMLVPSLHFNAPNPEIPLQDSPFYVNTQKKNWQTYAEPRRAGVSSFGVGGTNAHVVLEEAVSDDRALDLPTDSGNFEVIPLSANHSQCMGEIKQQLAEHLQQNPSLSLADIAFTLQYGRKPLKYRSALVASNLEDLVEQLSSSAGHNTLRPVMEGIERPLVFVFSGQSVGGLDCGRELYNNIPLIRDHMDQCFIAALNVLSIDLKKDFFLQETTEITTAGLLAMGVMKFCLEYSVARFLMDMGLSPYAMVGYSLGEYVAACLADVISLPDAIRITYERNLFYHDHVPEGAMLSVPLPARDIDNLIEGQVSLAAVNTESHCTLAGPSPAIHTIKAIIEEQHDCECVVLSVNRAAHSWMLDDHLHLFAERISDIRFRPPNLRYISSVTGNWITSELATDPAYWVKHLRDTVQFSDAAARLAEIPNALFLQPGNDKGVISFLKAAGAQPQHCLNLVKHKKDPRNEYAFFLQSMAQLWIQGIDVDWHKLKQTDQEKRVALPVYPFRKVPMFNPPSIEESLKQLGTGVSNGPSPIEQSVYEPSWVRLQGQNLPDDIPEQTTLLFLNKNCELSSQIETRLESFPGRLIRVFSGEEFTRLAPDAYQIAVHTEEDYRLLANALAEESSGPVHVIHGWLLDSHSCSSPDLPGHEGIERYMDLGFYSLMFWLQASSGYAGLTHNQISILTNNMCDVTGNDLLYPGKTTVLGIHTVMPVEYPDTPCRVVDCDLVHRSAATAKQADAILSEIYSPQSGELVALRGKRRWARHFVPVECAAQPRPLPVRENGVYLLAGGTGRIGVIIAGYLSSKAPVHIILNSRSGFPHREQWDEIIGKGEDTDLIQKIKRIREIEANGSTVTFITGDISKQADVNIIYDQLSTTYERIHGVIHCTLVKDEHPMLQFRTRHQTELALEGKVHGLLNLTRIFADQPTDFMLNCSSLASFLPIIGSAGYIAANTFIDSFTTYCNQQLNIRMLSINWSHWDFSGQTDVDLVMANESESAKHLISISDAAYIFDHYGDFDSPQIAVSKLPIAQLKQYLLSHTQTYLNSADLSQDQQQDAGRPAISTEYEPPVTDTEQRLAKIWGEHFGFSKIGITDSFFDLGGDSVKAIHIVGKIRQEFDLKIPLADLFNHHCIQGLAAYIDVCRLNPASAATHEYRYLRPLLQSTPSEFTIVAVPYAGGSSATYRKLANCLDTQATGVSLYTVAIPGNDFGDVIEERPDIETLADHCVKAILADVSGPFVLYGHCGGTVLALEIARQLNNKNRPPVSVCFGALTFSGQPLTDKELESLAQGSSNLQYLFDLMDGFSGKSTALPREEYDFIANNLNNDKKRAYAYMNQRLNEAADPLPFRLRLIVSRDDPMTLDYANKWKNWQRFFADVELSELNWGGHYFVDTRADRVTGILLEEITSLEGIEDV